MAFPGDLNTLRRTNMRKMLALALLLATTVGVPAEIVAQQFRLAKQKFFQGKTKPEYNLELFEQYRNPQLSLF